MIDPIYAHWQDVSGFTEERVRKAHATYCGEITMVDTWIGYLLRTVENMGLMDKTAVIFTSDHGFYFGEHGGLFGKLTFDKRPDGSVFDSGDPDATWTHSPLFEEVVRIPLLVYIPGAVPGARSQLTSAVDLMPTVLDILGREVPREVQGRSLLPTIRDGGSGPGREFVVSTVPFANPGEPVRSVDDLLRMLAASPITTISTDQWSLLYSVDAGVSELYDLSSDPGQHHNVITRRPEVAKEVHQFLVKFMRDTSVPDHLLKPRLELGI